MVGNKQHVEDKREAELASRKYRSETFKLIAQRIFPSESQDKARRKIKARCRRAVKSGKLAPGLYADPAYCNWAVSTYPALGIEQWMPEGALDTVGSIVITLPLPIVKAYGTTNVPTDIAGLTAALLEADSARARLIEQNAELLAKLAKAEQERDACARRLRERLKKASDSGGKGGRGKE